MEYNEYKPSILLEQFIDCYWISKNSCESTGSRILPDGYVDIIFNLDYSQDRYSKDDIRVSGMMTTYREVILTRNSETLGIRFKAGAFHSISNIPLSEIKNKTINFSDLSPKFNYSILEDLKNTNNHFEKNQIVNNILIQQIDWSNAKRNNLERSVCQSIHLNFQKIDLVKIAQDHFISLRQLERRFKAIVGVTMKEYHSIVRFKKNDRFYY